MKLSTQLVVSTFFFIVLLSTSCTKQCTTTTVNPLDIITSVPWKADEIRSNNDYYKRGGTSNNFNLDSDTLRFKKDYTGIYTNSGVNYPFTWSFTDAAMEKIQYTLQNYPNTSNTLGINMQNIVYTSTSLSYSEYYTRSGINHVGSVVRTAN